MSTTCPSTINVVVTGGAPYAKGCDYNTSALIRDALPATVERNEGPNIRIFKYPIDVDSTYSFVNDYIPKVWKGEGSTFGLDSTDTERIRIDIMLHMGMRRRENCFCVETQAHRDNYDQPGVDGEHLPPEKIGPDGAWQDLPEVLKTGFDISKVVEKMSKEVPHISIRSSDDAGMFFCEYQLYSSLAVLAKRNDFARAVFLHTPAPREDKDIEHGVQVAVALIKALADDPSFKVGT